MVQYTVKKSKERREYEKNLNKEMEEVSKLLSENPNEDIKQRYTTILKDLECINNEKTRGCQIRARAEHIEMNEHNSAYFFNKDKSRAKTKNIQCITLDNGQTITKTEEIIHCQKTYYQNLYKKPPDINNVDNSQVFLAKDNIPKLSNEQQHNLDKAITKEEIAMATKQLANGRYPGTDGLPIDFYKLFWTQIKECVYDSIKYATQHGIMSIDQRRGVLNLIPTKGKDI